MEAAKQYAVLYADSPWHYDMKRGNGVAENHYPTMSIEGNLHPSGSGACGKRQRSFSVGHVSAA